MKNIKEQWKDICNEYLKQFAEKHELSIEDRDDYNWVGCDYGTIATPGDYFVGMDTMRYDIDNDVQENLFFEWYDYMMILSELNLDNVNYESYVKGVRPYDNEDIERIRELKGKVIVAQNNLDKSIMELKRK